MVSHSHTRNIDVRVYDTHTEYHIPLYEDGWNKAEEHSLILHIDASGATTTFSGATTVATRLLSFGEKVSPEE